MRRLLKKRARLPRLLVSDGPWARMTDPLPLLDKQGKLARYFFGVDHGGASYTGVTFFPNPMIGSAP